MYYSKISLEPADLFTCYQNFKPIIFIERLFYCSQNIVISRIGSAQESNIVDWDIHMYVFK